MTYAERAARLHPHLVYQVDDVEAVTAERAAVLRRLAGRGRVLEVGCAVGSFSAVLAEAGHAVTGIEGDPRAAAEARDRGVAVVEGDVEDPATWAAAGGGWDAVLFMHVLEHLADPWEALRRARASLAPGGSVVSLLPNVAAWRVRRALFFRGRFDYADRGILDRTHLRFFTLDSGLALHRDAGFPIVEWEPVDTRAPFEPSIRYRLGLDGLAGAYGRAALARFPNLCTEVFCMEARP